MSFLAKIYSSVLRRSSTYALAIVSGAFFFERGFDLATERLYDEINKGVRIYVVKFIHPQVFFIFLSISLETMEGNQKQLCPSRGRMKIETSLTEI